jgi:phospholipase C
MVEIKLAAFVALASTVLAVPQGWIQNHGAGDWRSKIKNVVVLVEENRSFDTFAGGLSYNPAIDGLLHHNYCNSMCVSSVSFQSLETNGSIGMLQTRTRRTMFALVPAQTMSQQTTPIIASAVSTCSVSKTHLFKPNS